MPGPLKGVLCGIDIAAAVTGAPALLKALGSVPKQCKGGPKPPPPKPPPPKPSGWPTFSSLAALQADPWADYYKGVYGGLPTSFPISTQDFWMLYDGELIKAKVAKAPASVGPCPTANPPIGQHYN